MCCVSSVIGACINFLEYPRDWAVAGVVILPFRGKGDSFRSVCSGRSCSLTAVNFGERVISEPYLEMESMDIMESDGSIQLTTSVDDISSSYATSYLESFLPAYQMVNQSAISGVADRYRAIKFAADASLALTASGASWSDALSKMLAEVSEGTASLDVASSNEDEFLGRSDAGPDALASANSSREQSPMLDSNDICEPSSFSETVSWGRKLGSNSLNHTRPSSGGRMSVYLRFAGRGGRKNLSRNQKLSRDLSRLAILRTLSSKCKNKRRLCKSASKPKAGVRKVKSLARSRRRLPSFAKPLVFGAPEQRLENGLAALQRLVPGGSNMDAAVLLDEAADFVMFLKLQVHALQSVANAVGIDACSLDS